MLVESNTNENPFSNFLIGEGQTDFNGDPQGCEYINKDSTYTITLPCTNILRSGVYSHLIHVNVPY